MAAGGIGGIIKTAQPQSKTTLETFYTYDGIGSVANLTNTTGVSTQTYTYDAFGNRVAPTGTSTNVNQFLTKETDSTGLVYFGRRYYDPE